MGPNRFSICMRFKNYWILFSEPCPNINSNNLDKSKILGSSRFLPFFVFSNFSCMFLDPHIRKRKQQMIHSKSTLLITLKVKKTKAKVILALWYKQIVKIKQIYYIELLLIIALQSIVVVLDLFKNEKQAKNKHLP